MRLKTQTEAARILGISRYALRKGMWEGRYPYITHGDRILFDIDKLETILKTEKLPDNLITVQELSKEIGKSVNTINKYTSENKIPVYQSYPKRLFMLDDVKRALNIE